MRRNKLLYLEIADSIKEKILDGFYPIDSKIPTENELELEYNVSKITIRRAVGILVSEGYLEKGSGKGTVVISNRLFNFLSKARSFSTIIESKGHQLTKEIRSIEKVSIDVKDDELHSLFDQDAYKLTRLYYLDNEPYIYFQHYLPVLGDKKKLEKLSQESLYKWLAFHGKQVAHFEDSFKVIKVDKEIKKMLLTKESYILKRTRKAISEESEVIEFSIAYYDTEKQSYMIDYDV